MASLFFDFLGLGGLVGSFLPQNEGGIIAGKILDPIGTIINLSLGQQQKQPTDYVKIFIECSEIIGVGIVGIGVIRFLT